MAVRKVDHLAILSTLTDNLALEATCPGQYCDSGATSSMMLTLAVKPQSWEANQDHSRKMERNTSSNRSNRLVDPFQIECDERTHEKPTYISNTIYTSKYNILNFLSLCLFQEFWRVQCWRIVYCH